MSIECFIEIDGVEGESVVKDFEGQIDVLAWSWGMSQSGTSHVGGGSGSGRASVQDLSITKYTDSATHALIKACLTGEHFETATLTARKAGGEALIYFKVVMNKVLITSVSAGASQGEDRQTENVTLNFGKVEVEYTPQDEKGAGGAAKTVIYNIAANAVE